MTSITYWGRVGVAFAAAAAGLTVASPTPGAGPRPVSYPATGAPVTARAEPSAVVARRDPPPTPKSHTDGEIDFNADVERQIQILEERFLGNLDLEAERQAVMLRWLIDLYNLAGKNERVEWAYRQILAYFPTDIGTMNDYASWLIERRHQFARARSLLTEASGWARETDARARDRGRTLQLLARVNIELGDFESAMHQAESALALVAETNVTGVLKLKARALAGSGNDDAAAAVYLEAIARERGTNADDVDAFASLAPRTRAFSGVSVEEAISDAIDRHRDSLAARLESEGARLVDIRTADGTLLEATLRPASNAVAAVLLIHDPDDDRSGWAPYAQLLFVDGISTLSVDLRGHGGSRTANVPSPAAARSIPPAETASDIRSAYAWLASKTTFGDEQLAIVSAGASATAVELAIRDSGISPSVVHVSPVFPVDDLDLKTALSFRQDLPTLLLVSTEDLKALRSASVFLKAKTLSKTRSARFSGAGHGIDVLRRDPKALATWLEWLKESTVAR